MSEQMTKGEITRQKIIKNSIKLFAKKGFAHTSFQEIANQCKISQPAIFIHFKTKKDLLNSVRKFVSKSNHTYVDGLITHKMNAEEALFNHCVGNVKWAIENPDEAQIIVLTYYYSFFDKEFKEIFPSVIDLGTERILKYVLAGIREGLFSSKFTPKQIAILIHEHLVGLYFRNLPARAAAHWTPDENKRFRYFLDRILKSN